MRAQEKERMRLERLSRSEPMFAKICPKMKHEFEIKRAIDNISYQDWLIQRISEYLKI